MRMGMKRIVHSQILSWILLGLAGFGIAAEEPVRRPYEMAEFRVPVSEIDRLVFEAQRKAGVELARPCSDSVFVRRVYLDVLGILPEGREAREFLRDRAPDKRAVLIDALLARDEYVDYWSMKWCDLLRVKSEFPINLWPDAVQAYHRWVREALRENMPYDTMARELLTSSGSNFRVPQVNFFRAVQGSGKEAVAEAVALTFMGSRIEHWPADRREGMETMFSRVSFKPTGEWKEEIVCLDPSAIGPLEAVFPDGGVARVVPGADPRAVFADWLIAADNRWFARAGVNRTWAWIFGRGIVHDPDDIRPANPPSIPGLLEHLEKEFVASRYDMKCMLRVILNSRVYQLSPLPRSEYARAPELFASYPVRRLDAEVLLDAICKLTGTQEGYMSPIPEPFTYIPQSARSVNLADGSITSAFLEMFGRCQRDTGLVLERNNRISDSQRLHMLNSSDIQRKIEKSRRFKNMVKNHRKDRAALVRALWMEILSRYPTRAEEQEAVGYGENLKGRQATDDLIWALINSKEFLYRH